MCSLSADEDYRNGIKVTGSRFLRFQAFSTAVRQTFSEAELGVKMDFVLASIACK